MSFKEDVKNIDLPKHLHERSRKGIERAQREKKKGNHLKPALLTIIVTASMMMFVFSQLTSDQSTNVTTAASKDNGMPPFAISIAYIVTVASIIGIVLLWLKKRVSRLLLILSFLAIMSTTWITSLKYTYELLDTEIYPISEEVVSDFMVSISLDYMQPKSKAPIRALYINDKNILTYNYDIQTVFQPFPFRLFNEFTNIYIQIPIEDIPDIISDEPIQARALFADYTEMDVDIELFTIINKSEITIYYQDPTYEETEQNWIGTNEFHFFKDTYVEEIQFPKRLVGLGSWKLVINNDVIHEGPISKERFDLSRPILKNDAIKLTYEVPKQLNVPLDGWIYFIENNNKILIERIGQSATVTEDYLRLIVKKQRGEQREN